MLQRLVGLSHNRYAGAVAAGSVVGIVLLLLFLLLRGQRDTVVLEVQPIEDSSIVRVYVGGEVTSPGLFSLERGSRVADAIEAAGGVLTAADTSAIGMASVLRDADQIIVPARRPTPAAAAAASTAVSTPFTGSSPVDTPIPVEVVGPIDINNAPASELDVLPGVGPAISERIVVYRLQNGPFQTLEELAEVSGISERMVDELRPLITLGH